MNSRQKEIAFEKIFEPIKSLIGSICYRRYNLGDTNLCPECPDCEGRLLDKIQEDDYKLIRKFGGNKSRQGTEIFEKLFEIDGDIKVRGRNKAKFTSYLTSAFNNAIVDDIGGRYVASQKAIKLGECALKLDYQIWKGSSLEEAHQHIITIDECRKITFDQAKDFEKKIKRKSRKRKTKVDTYTDVTKYLLDTEANALRNGESEVKTGIIDEELEREEEKRNKKVAGNNPLSSIEKIEDEEREKKYNEIFNDFIRNYKKRDQFMFNAYYSGANILSISRSRGETRYITEVKIKNMMEDLLDLCGKNNILPPGYKDKKYPNFLANQRREGVEAEKKIFQEKKEKEKASNYIREERDKSLANRLGEKALREAKEALARLRGEN